MDFPAALAQSPYIIAEGGTTERIKREFSLDLDFYIADAGLIYNDRGYKALEKIYSEYLHTGYQYNLPLMIATPTWRANPERLVNAGFHKNNVNRDCFVFLNKLRNCYREYAQLVYIGGSTACKGDAYKPEEALSPAEAESFHSTQVQELAAAGVDFLITYTLPSAAEALGIARAMSCTGKPYILSFVVRPGGTLLDGTSLHEAILSIDDSVSPPPVIYMINCVHASIFYNAITHPVNSSPLVRKRVLGLQANTSKKSPEELDNLPGLDAEVPEDFARSMVSLYEETKIKILGGCCGTDNHHIQKMVQLLIKKTGPSHGTQRL